MKPAASAFAQFVSNSIKKYELSSQSSNPMTLVFAAIGLTLAQVSRVREKLRHQHHLPHDHRNGG
ncbi:MAG: hypothetical protein ACK41O_26975, partial [Runella zeae]